jgi:polar amino acid transport system substrate-binding protein
MRPKKADLTLAIFITSARDEVFDFSYPISDAGLQIMVRDTHQTAATANPLWDLLRLIFSRTTVAWLGMALLLVLIPAHVVWVLERRREDGAISSRKYFPGIFESAYWALSTLVCADRIKMTRAALERWGGWMKQRRPRVILERVDADLLVRLSM